LGLSFSLKIRDIIRRIKRNRTSVLVVLVWSIVIAILVIKAYLDFFNSHTSEYSYYLRREGIPPPFYRWQGPRLTGFDVLIISVVSLMCGAILVEIGKVFYASVTAFIISSSLTTVYIANFIWHVLGWGCVLSTTGWGWSWALYWGFLNTFRIMFPIALLLSIFSAIGVFLRSLFYSAM